MDTTNTVQDTEEGVVDPVVTAFVDQIVASEEATAQLLDGIHQNINEIEEELEGAEADIEAAVVEANAEIDDAVMELLADVEGE